MKYILKTQNLLNIALLNVFLISSCASTESTEAKLDPITEKSLVPIITQCTNPRTKICTRDYHPVCAARDSGIRCVTTPCPSTKTATYPNGCSACADPKVFHYQAGKCEISD